MSSPTPASEPGTAAGATGCDVAAVPDFDAFSRAQKPPPAGSAVAAGAGTTGAAEVAPADTVLPGSAGASDGFAAAKLTPVDTVNELAGAAGAADVGAAAGFTTENDCVAACAFAGCTTNVVVVGFVLGATVGVVLVCGVLNAGTGIAALTAGAGAGADVTVAAFPANRRCASACA